MSKQVQVTVYNCNRPYIDGKQLIINLSKLNSLNDIIESASFILEMKAKSISQFHLYAECGQEINDINYIINCLSNNDNIFLCNGIERISNDILITITMLGDDGCGKSSLVFKYVYGMYESDIFGKETKLISIDGIPTYCSICYSSQWHPAARNWKDLVDVNGFCLVFDISNKKSLKGLEIFYNYLYELYHDNIPPFILIGNKCDLDHVYIKNSNQIYKIVTNWCLNKLSNDILYLIGTFCEISTREVSIEKGENMATQWNAVKYIETSAKNGENIEKAFGCLLRNIIIHSIPSQKKKKKHNCIVI